MKNRVAIIKSKYHVDTENKVVVCELTCDLQLGKHPAWFYITPNMWKKLPNVNYAGVFTVKAIARCNSVDTFNEETGKRIAESRAKIKMFKTASKVWAYCTKALQRHVNECFVTHRACEEAIEVEENHVKELTV